MRHLLALALLCVLPWLRLADGHGRIIEPPGRSSMWAFGFKTPANYEDDELNCGGFGTQHDKNGGKCGVCGDPYQLPQPRPNEAGGRFGNGIIVRNYKEGDVVPVTVDITTNHNGWFTFKLCPTNDKLKIATQECLDQYPMTFEDGNTKWPVPGNFRAKKLDFKMTLPKGLTCSQCVLQWDWVVANSWGSCGNGTERIGCGPQETFRGCADVSIQ